MHKFATATLVSVLFACAPASIDAHAQTIASGATPLNGEQLRHLLKDTNTYLVPAQPGDVVVDHPRSELLRADGSYHRRTGRTGLEGTYAVEGNAICVVGLGISKQCRGMTPQGGNTYLLVDVSDGSQALVELSRRK